MKRKGISKKTRFEVFKRDSFICQYCGRPAPNVILVVDHIKPVVAEGDNDILNLITSCQECNQGKGKHELNDDTVISKRKKQLDELQEKREQIDMIYEWQLGLINIEEDTTRKAIEYLQMFTIGITFNEPAYRSMSKTIRKYGFAEVLECIRISVEQYIEILNGVTTQNSAIKVFDYIDRIASTRKKMRDKPYLGDLYYIKGILHNSMHCIDWMALKLLETAFLNGHSIDELKSIAIDSPNWTAWTIAMRNLPESVQS